MKKMKRLFSLVLCMMMLTAVFSAALAEEAEEPEGAETVSEETIGSEDMPETEEPEAEPDPTPEPEDTPEPEATPEPEVATEPEPTPAETEEPAEEADPEETEAAPEKKPAPELSRTPEKDDSPETLDWNEYAPMGFEAPASKDGRKSSVDRKTLDALAAGEAVTFTLNDGITAVLKDGVMTVSGSGAVTGFSKAEQAPWYEIRDEIQQVVYGKGITDTGARTFWYCENLTSLSIPDSVGIVADSFLGCTALKRVDLPASVKTICGGAFCDCVSLEAVTAPGAEYIGGYAFQRTAIRQFTFAKTLTRVEMTAFWKSAVETFAVASGNAAYTAKDGVVYTDGGSTVAFYPTGRKSAAVRIPDGVTTVGEGAFASNPHIKKLDLNAVKTVGYSAFASCTGLESLTIPDSVTTMGSCAFEDCTGLKSVAFGKGLKETGYRVFCGCESLETISFGTKLETIGGLCFAYCNSLKSVTLPETIGKVENGCFGECAGLESFTATALTVIPYQMLLNDVKLTSLNLNEGITEINRYAVYGCRSLETVTAPKSVTLIADNAFDKRYTAVDVKNGDIDPYGYYGWRRQEYITVEGLRNYDKAYEVLAIVNRERAAAGLDPLVMDADLCECAMRRAAELSVQYSHTRPDSSAFFSLSGRVWAENAAEYQTTADAVMTAWMHSEGHRRNLMNRSYTTIGVGCFEVDGRCYWVQWFGKGTASEAAKPQNGTATETIGYAVEMFHDAPNTADVVFSFEKEPEYSYRFEVEKNGYGMKAGQTQTIRAYLRGCCDDAKGRHLNAQLSYGADQLVWTSSDPSVATVNNGVVTAKKDGKAIITVRTRKGCYSQKVTISVGTLAVADVTFRSGDVQFKGSTPYAVYNGKAQKPGVVVKNGDGTTVDPSEYTVSYKDNVNPGTAQAIVTMKDGGESRSVWFKIFLPPTAETNVIVASYGTVVFWEPVEGAAGYVVYRRAWSSTTNGWTAFERWNNTTATNFHDRKVYAGTRYQYGVKAYFAQRTDGSGQKIGGAMDNYNLGVVGPLKTTVFITQRELTSVTAGRGQLTAKWDESKVFSGYQLQVSSDRYFGKDVKTVKIADPKKHAMTVTGLKSGTTYYVRVRSYQAFEGMTYFGPWSDAEMSCKVK